MTYSLLDQSILNWPNIQTWAQKQWMKRQQSGRSIHDSHSGNSSNHSGHHHGSNGSTNRQGVVDSVDLSVLNAHGKNMLDSFGTFTLYLSQDVEFSLNFPYSVLSNCQFYSRTSDLKCLYCKIQTKVQDSIVLVFDI